MQPQRPQSAFNRDGILHALRIDPMLPFVDRFAPARLNQGDEYVDLQRLAAGVQVAPRRMTATGGELGRNTVAPDTWAKLLSYMAL